MGIDITDWDLGSGIRINDWGVGLGFEIGDVDWDLELALLLAIWNW